MSSETEQWCLSWSHSQQALHTETLAEHMHGNQHDFASGTAPAADYRLLFIGSHADVIAAAHAAQVMARS